MASSSTSPSTTKVSRRRASLADFVGTTARRAQPPRTSEDTSTHLEHLHELPSRKAHRRSWQNNLTGTWTADWQKHNDAIAAVLRGYHCAHQQQQQQQHACTVATHPCPPLCSIGVSWLTLQVAKSRDKLVYISHTRKHLTVEERSITGSHTATVKLDGRPHAGTVYKRSCIMRAAVQPEAEGSVEVASLRAQFGDTGDAQLVQSWRPVDAATVAHCLVVTRHGAEAARAEYLLSRDRRYAQPSFAATSQAARSRLRAISVAVRGGGGSSKGKGDLAGLVSAAVQEGRHRSATQQPTMEPRMAVLRQRRQQAAASLSTRAGTAEAPAGNQSAGAAAPPPQHPLSAASARNTRRLPAVLLKLPPPARLALQVLGLLCTLWLLALVVALWPRLLLYLLPVALLVELASRWLCRTRTAARAAAPESLSALARQGAPSATTLQHQQPPPQHEPQEEEEAPTTSTAHTDIADTWL